MNGTYTAQDEIEYRRMMADKRQYLQAQADGTFNPIKMAGDFCNGQPLYYDPAGIWWMWRADKYKWDITDEIEIINALRYTFDLNGISNPSFQNQILTALKLVARDRKPKEMPLSYIQFGRKIHDVNTKESHLADETYFSKNVLPYTPSDDPATPHIDAFIESVVGKNNVKLIHQQLAYCCYRGYPIHRYFIWYGPGSNGKGTLGRHFIKFLGMDNVVALDLEDIQNSRFALSQSYGKLLICMSETNVSTLNKSSVLKKITSGDPVTYEFKNKQPFTDLPYCKINIQTNAIPTTSDKTDGFFRRPLIVDFPNQFNESKDPLKDIPEYDYNNLARKILDILPELIEKRAFDNEGSIADRRKAYEDRSNPIRLFISERCEADLNKFVFKFEFKDAFLAWAKERKYRELGDKEISLWMKSEGYEEKREPKQFFNEGSFENKYIWAWLGLSFKQSDCKDCKDCKGSYTQSIYIENQVKSADNPYNGCRTPQESPLNADDLRCFLLDKSMMSYDDLIYRGFTQSQIDDWKSQGLIFEHKPGYVRLL